MVAEYTFELELWNAPNVLPRVALILSRRRITPAHMLFELTRDLQRCDLQFTIVCDQRAAERLRAQLARVVELIELCMHSTTVGPRSPLDPDASEAA